MDSILNSFEVTLKNADFRQFIESLICALEMKDYYSKGHSLRVAGIAALIGNEFDFSSDKLFWLYIGGYLHDIGKIGIADNILKKKGALTIKEYDEMKKHPEKGVQIIEKVDALKKVIPMVKYHHERIDGKGYPEGIQGADFGLMPRIVCVADSIDAMASHRAYRRAMPWVKVKYELQEHSNSQFDSKIIFTAIKIFNRWKEDEWNEYFNTFLEPAEPIIEVDYSKLMNERYSE